MQVKNKTIKTTGSNLVRPRRLRLNPGLRGMVRETELKAADFIYPLFVRPGENIKKPIKSMPGQFQFSIDLAVIEAQEAYRLGIPAVILFGIPSQKDSCGSENYDPQGIIPRAIRAIKSAVPELIVISDMCFCEYTTHGHCGLINTPSDEYYNPNLPEGYLLNDPTLELLSRASIVHAQAGADVIAPSGMIDNMVEKIRSALDANSFEHVSVMSYAVKYASGFYGPFRDAAESPPGFGDRSQYQMDPANRREALTEAGLDIVQGTDILIVKPALAYLDIIADVRANFNIPLAAYQVSGEYAMIHAAAQNGWLDLKRVGLESLTSIKRAGADMIISYFAKDAVTWLKA